MYPVLANVVAGLSGLVSFSLVGLLLLFVLLGLCLVFFVAWRRGFLYAIVRLFFAAVFVLVPLYAVFIFGWGINYGRQPLVQILQLDDLVVGQNDVERLLLKLEKILQENADAPRLPARALLSLRQSLESNLLKTTGAQLHLPNIKRTWPGLLLRLGNASGVTAGFSGEAHVDGGLSETDAVAVAAHELAHLAGFAGEADADAFAAFAGLTASDPYARYAVALHQWWLVVAVLPRAVRQQRVSELPSQAQEDLRVMRLAYVQFQMPEFVQRAQQFVYDLYLKRQGVVAGVEDYSRATGLLVRMMRKNLF